MHKEIRKDVSLKAWVNWTVPLQRAREGKAVRKSIRFGKFELKLVQLRLED